MSAPPLILTLKLDQIAFDRLNALRQRYFPPERNFLPAHITLFHALPGDRLDSIEQHLQAVCDETRSLHLQFLRLRSLGKGVAAEIECPPLISLHQHLATDWQAWLSPQDRQKFKPHVTIQNKVTPEEARQTYDDLAAVWHPFG
ncbi:MAG: 2'-5' RNA ligase family protein, partial [Microcoleus sp. SIO2G3]|nr:2'-5' RNA ligase family protein [Microcoleus sp. SIO2G3]